MQFEFSVSTFRRLWLIMLLALLIAGMVFALDVAAQGEESPQLRVITEALNVRTGPGVNYPVIDVLLQGDQIPVIGHDTPSGWWQVQLEDGRSGWVSGGAAYVQEVSGDTENVPEVTAPVAAAGGAPPVQTSTVVFQTVSGGPIYAIGADGTNLRYLTDGIDPALSPDGQQVAFTRWEGPGHGAPGSLWVINTDGTGERVILEDVNQPKSPVWSPDGTQIAISMQKGGRVNDEYKCSRSLPNDPIKEDFEDIRVVVEVDPDGDVEIKYCYTLLPHPFWGLRMVNVATGEFEDLPRDLFSYAPTWDPANDWRLVYDGELGLVNLDLNQGTTWALTDDPNDHTPTFSPDGSRIAVAYKQHDHWDIHVMNADGSGRVRLTETPLRVIVEQQINGEEPHSWNNAAPVWSPDGTEIMFLTDRTGQWEVWIMNADGSNQRSLFPAGTLDDLELQYYGVGERALSWR
jgi:dipeptidyl aminopeptidase/acylaminoacyl peptidase/uncharacterized protein YraI